MVIYYIIFFYKANYKYKGSFIINDLKITGKRGLKFIFSFSIDILKNIDLSTYNQSLLTANEKIINNEYTYFIPAIVSYNCEKGQFFDNIKYFQK